jgi:hypothetical protein
MSSQPLNLYDVDDYTASKKGQVVANYAGDSVEVEYRFDITDGPVASTDTDVQSIPAGSVLESVDVFIETTLAGGTNWTLGLQESDGTQIDNDGIIAASTATTGYVSAGGVDIGTVPSATVDGQLVLSTSGSYTAGVLKVVVKYKKA